MFEGQNLNQVRPCRGDVDNCVRLRVKGEVLTNRRTTDRSKGESNVKDLVFYNLVV